jgi:RNA-binding protein
MTELTQVQRRDLRARAHHLNPVVSIAGNGLTPAVLAEAERSLQAHELIKIKVHGAERDQREALMTELCEALDAAPVQHIGTMLVIWRQRREEDASSAPGKADKPSGAARPSQAKSASSFATLARRSALLQAAADKKRLAARGSKRGPRKHPGERDK